jgi:hypothetical protein
MLLKGKGKEVGREAEKIRRQAQPHAPDSGRRVVVV